ncbi:MAG: addiction module toxin RelE [Nanoarchaeota archaeon]
MFEYDFREELKLKIKKILKKDKKKAEIIYKKIKEIVNNDSETIKRYKNLRHDLSDLKRVHIDKSFVLTFKVDIADNFILFWDFDHHDNIY